MVNLSIKEETKIELADKIIEKFSKPILRKSMMKKFINIRK